MKNKIKKDQIKWRDLKRKEKKKIKKIHLMRMGKTDFTNTFKHFLHQETSAYVVFNIIEPAVGEIGGKSRTLCTVIHKRNILYKEKKDKKFTNIKQEKDYCVCDCVCVSECVV